MIYVLTDHVEDSFILKARFWFADLIVNLFKFTNVLSLKKSRGEGLKGIIQMQHAKKQYSQSVVLTNQLGS